MEKKIINGKCVKYFFTDEEIQDMFNMYYNEDCTIENISNKYGVSDFPIKRIFKEHGWKLADCHRHSRRYSLNENYFDKIDTPNKAYIIGLLQADGYNEVQNNSIKLCLQDTDVQILNDIKLELNYNIPLEHRTFPNHPTWHDAYILNINSKHMSQRLNELGIVQNKSLILDFPQWITKELFPFMLKGYCDGDGWIQSNRIGFMGTDKYCYGVKEYLNNNYNISSSVIDMKRHYNEHTKTWYVCNQKTIKQLSELMFSQSCLGIQRKVQKYIDYGFILSDTNSSLSA